VTSSSATDRLTVLREHEVHALGVPALGFHASARAARRIRRDAAGFHVERHAPLHDERQLVVGHAATRDGAGSKRGRDDDIAQRYRIEDLAARQARRLLVQSERGTGADDLSPRTDQTSDGTTRPLDRMSHDAFELLGRLQQDAAHPGVGSDRDHAVVVEGGRVCRLVRLTPILDPRGAQVPAQQHRGIGVSSEERVEPRFVAATEHSHRHGRDPTSPSCTGAAPSKATPDRGRRVPSESP
jgi:hypothetical protein